MSSNRNFKDDGNQGFPGGLGVKNLPADAGDTGLSPNLGRSYRPQLRLCAATIKPML